MRTWSTHTVELGDVLARVNNMLRRARRFLVGATVYGVLKCPTFAVCLWVVHLEPHLLDNTGPLTRDTAVRRGVFLTRGLPLTLSDCDMRHRGPGIVYFYRSIAVTSDFYVVVGAIGIRETHLPLCRAVARLASVSFFYSAERSVKKEGKSLVKGPRFVETRGATAARAQAKEICENSS